MEAAGFAVIFWSLYTKLHSVTCQEIVILTYFLHQLAVYIKPCTTVRFDKPYRPAS